MRLAASPHWEGTVKQCGKVILCGSEHPQTLGAGNGAEATSAEPLTEVRVGRRQSRDASKTR